MQYFPLNLSKDLFCHHNVHVFKIWEHQKELMLSIFIGCPMIKFCQAVAAIMDFQMTQKTEIW